MKIVSSVMFVVIAFAGLTACDGNTPIRVPTMSASVGRAQNQTDGKLLISASNLLSNHTYGLGIWISGQPRKIGTLTTDGTGSINNTGVEYSCIAQVNTLHAELYELVGVDLGAGIVQTVVEGQNPCS